jgi:hypothetical protein
MRATVPRCAYPQTFSCLQPFLHPVPLFSVRLELTSASRRATHCLRPCVHKACCHSNGSYFPANIVSNLSKSVGILSHATGSNSAPEPDSTGLTYRTRWSSHPLQPIKPYSCPIPFVYSHPKWVFKSSSTKPCDSVKTPMSSDNEDEAVLSEGIDTSIPRPNPSWL